MSRAELLAFVERYTEADYLLGRSFRDQHGTTFRVTSLDPDTGNLGVYYERLSPYRLSIWNLAGLVAGLLSQTIKEV